MKGTAVIVGHNFNSILGLARALGPAGYDVRVIRTGLRTANGKVIRGTAPDSKCKYISRYIVADSQDPETIIRLLKTSFADQGRKAALFPVDDIAAGIIDGHYDELKERYLLPDANGTQGGVVKLMDKNYQKALAKEAGLPAPEGWTIWIENGVFTIPEEIVYPCFAKPQTPILRRKRYTKKCASKTELTELLKAAAGNGDCLMLVEEYVEIEAEYGVVGMCRNGRVCIPAIIEKVVEGHGSHAGVTAVGTLHRPSEFGETADRIAKFLTLARFCGIYDIDLYRSGGKMYFNEMNVRMGAAGAGVLACGVNLAEMFIESFTDDKAVDYSAQTKLMTFANEKPLSGDYGEGYISFKEYRERIKSADYRFIYSKDDIAPYKDYRVFFLRQMKKRRRLKKKK